MLMIKMEIRHTAICSAPMLIIIVRVVVYLNIIRVVLAEHDAVVEALCGQRIVLVSDVWQHRRRRPRGERGRGVLELLGTKK